MNSSIQRASISFDKSSSLDDTVPTNCDPVASAARVSRPNSSSGAATTTTAKTKKKEIKQSSFSVSDQQKHHHLQVKFTNSTLFLTACANGDLEECSRLLGENLVHVDTTTCDGLTGLHEAAICGNGDLVEYLLDRGANIDCRDNEGWTPLHAAASLGRTNIVELLLERQADATIINCENFLAYDLARNDECRELIGKRLEGQDIEYLRSQEERIIEQDINKWIQTGLYSERSHPATGATVLHVLAAKGNLDLLKKILQSPILKKQINLEAKDNEGYTPLLAASFWNQNDVVQLLIEHGANIFAQADDGYKISSIHLKNYQQSKLQQPAPIVTPRNNRTSLLSLDSDLNSESTNTAQSRRSLASQDSSENESTGDNIPNAASTRDPISQGQLIKSKSVELSGSQKSEQSPLLSSSMSVDRLLLRVESMGERDLRKSFKELVMENERLKQQLKGFDDKDKQQQQEWIRKERQLHRKISELEEENKQIEQWRQEIQRLKDENSSLIRVVSKLTKH